MLWGSRPSLSVALQTFLFEVMLSYRLSQGSNWGGNRVRWRGWSKCKEKQQQRTKQVVLVFFQLQCHVFAKSLSHSSCVGLQSERTAAMRCSTTGRHCSVTALKTGSMKVNRQAGFLTPVCRTLPLGLSSLIDLKAL